MKKNSRGLILIAIMIMIVVIFYTNNTIKNMPKPVNDYDELMMYDFDNDYPEDVTGVIDLNNKIMEYLYGDEITKDQIEPLVNLQRNLFANTLLELNPIETQVNEISKQIEAYQQNKIKLSSTKLYSTEYDSKSSSICIVKMLYYMTKGDDIYRTYTLIKDETKKWKIYTWNDSTTGFISTEDLKNGK